MLLLEPGSPDAEIFDEAMRETHNRYAAEDPTGAAFISRDRLELSVRSLQHARSELLRLLLSNRSASQAARTTRALGGRE